MTEEKKRFTRWVRYDNLSDEQKKEFKKALFLTKGASNNNVGCALAYFGLGAEAIAEFGALWKDARDVDQGEVLCCKKARFASRQAVRLLDQQYRRVPQLFDTIRGRSLVAKYGDDIKQEFCNANGECALSVVDPKVNPMGKLGGDYLEKVAGGCAPLSRLKRHLEEKRCVEFSAGKRLRLEFLTKINPVENARAAAKGFDLGSIYTASISGSVDIEYYQDLEKDFWGFFTQDLYGLANAPIEQFKKLLQIGDDVNLKDVIGSEVSIIGRIGEELTHKSYFSRDVYSTQPNATYNALYIRAMYQAMDEMGVGVATSHRMGRSRGRFSTRVKKIASKAISLNEKYQKMLKNKSNKIEPAILRETLVGMFNEYADRSGIEYRMFIREDRPAPTLASLKPEKKPKAATKAKSKAPRKRSTGPKEVVKVDGGGTFVEY